MPISAATIGPVMRARNWLSTWARAVTQRRVVIGALKVSFVVGGVLNAINQGDHLLSGDGILWGRLWLNYLVPYCVSSYSAARMSVLQRPSVRRTDSQAERD